MVNSPRSWRTDRAHRPIQTANRGDRPTLAELRAHAHKRHHRTIGNVLARRIARPLAIPGAWIAVRLGLSAHAVTTLALLTTMLAALAIATGSPIGFALGVALLHLAFWLDHVDGQVARWRGTDSLNGVYFDYLMHHAHSLLLGFALGFGLASRTGQIAWTAVGFGLAMGWLALGLHNDCRYKAFFQRLKSAHCEFLAQGGGGGRPAPAPGWPRSWPGLLAWPLAKLCEPHVVLIGLTLLAPCALLWPATWLIACELAVSGGAIIALGLACARIVRAIRSNAIELEFDAWFTLQSRPSQHADDPHSGRDLTRRSQWDNGPGPTHGKPSQLAAP